MTPALIATVLGLLEKYGPSVARLAYDLIHKPNPSPADFNEVFAAAAALDYDKAIADAREKIAK
jgi:hypothetical protein